MHWSGSACLQTDEETAEPVEVEVTLSRYALLSKISLQFSILHCMQVWTSQRLFLSAFGEGTAYTTPNPELADTGNT